MVMFLRSALRAKRFYLSLTGAILAGGATFAFLDKLRLEGEIGWIETIIGTVAAYFIAKRAILFVWDRVDKFVRSQIKMASDQLKNRNN